MVLARPDELNNSEMDQRKLGTQGLVVSAQGFGAMGMTAFYKANDQNSEEENLATIGKALEVGINFFDTAWIYQNFETGETNEALLGKAIKKYGRDKFVVATKFGIVPGPSGLGFDGSPAAVRKQLTESLERLGIDCIDLYYMHRMDPKTPIEETMKCLLELKNEGKIKYVGLSECTASELERAHAVFPVSAIQMEWSLQTRDLEETVVPTARKLGVGIVAYSPLGRGFLSRTFTKKEELHPGDWRNTQPRFGGDNFDKNVEAAAKLEAIAVRKGVTAAQASRPHPSRHALARARKSRPLARKPAAPIFASARSRTAAALMFSFVSVGWLGGWGGAQLALAWVHSRGEDVFPIPGTRRHASPPLPHLPLPLPSPAPISLPSPSPISLPSPTFLPVPLPSLLISCSGGRALSRVPARRTAARRA